FHQRSGIHSFLESSRVNERQHCSPGGPAGLQRAVVLVVFEIATAYQHQNVTGGVVQADDCALQILGCRLVRSGSRRSVCLGFAKRGCISGVSLMIVFRTLLHRFEMSPERILCYLLKTNVDSRVNAKAFVHRAVPSYGRDNLLADIIDCVGLALRILPAPNDDLFRSRSSASLAADEAEVAHPIERVVAYLA